MIAIPATMLVLAFLPMDNTQTATHVSNRFEFVVHAPMARAALLFGPEGERSWAGTDWNPKFLHPQPAKDLQGAVFTTEHGLHKSVWINTIFDLAQGRMQYVVFVTGTMVSTIDVRLTAQDSSMTKVEVTYVRTALDESANDDVKASGERDRNSGVHWQEAIAAALAAERK